MGLELFVGDDFFRHGEGLQREGSGKVHVGTVSAGSQTRTTNHNALKSQTILFVYNEKKNTENSENVGSFPTLSERGLPEKFVVVHTKISRSKATFNVPRR